MTRFTRESKELITIDDLDGVDHDVTMEVRLKPDDLGSLVAAHHNGVVVLGYLMQDSDPENPMTSYDAQGVVYTMPKNGYGGGVITDNASEVYSALCIDSNGFPDNSSLTLGDYTASLRQHAAETYLNENYGHELTDEWLDWFENDPSDDEDRSIANRDEMLQDMVDGSFKDDEVGVEMIKLYTQHWRQIVGPYVIPISYHSERGSTSIGVTSWDGDPDDLPDGVWVADRDAIENIEHQPLPRDVIVEFSENEKVWRVLHDVGGGVNRPFKDMDEALAFAHTLGEGDLAWAAERYAKAVLSEFEIWCNGDVYGVIVVKGKIDPNNPEAVISYEDSLANMNETWGFFGLEYAERSLQEEVEGVIETLKNEEKK